MNLNKGVLKVFGIVPIILFLYGSLSALSTVYNSKVSWVIYASLFAILVLSSRKLDYNLKMNNPVNIVFVFLIVMVACYCVVYISIDEIYSSILLVLTLLVSLVVVRTISFPRFVNIYLMTMRVLSIISLVFYFLTIYAGIFIPYIRMLNVNRITYYNWWINVMMETTGGVFLHRIMSVFWEPGIFASFLVIGILFECRFVNRKPDIFNIILFIVCVYFTFSTAGYLLLPLCACYIFFDTDNKVLKGILSVVFVVFVILFVSGYEQIMRWLASWNYSVFYKFVETSGSYSTRIFAYEIEFDILKASNYLGAGLNGSSALFEELRNSYSYSIGARTSTSMMYISSYGIAGCMYTLAWVYGCFKKTPGNWIEKMMILIIMLIIVNKEPHMRCIATTCILFYMLDADTVFERKAANAIKE